MQRNLAQQAIILALSGKWKEARDINLQLLKETPNDIDSLNRLAKAYYELGNITAARQNINKVLKIDPYNPIAVKCYEKWKNLKKAQVNTSKQLSADLFLEEPGKTKIIHLIHTCDKPVISNLNCGDIVNANSKSHRISLMTDTNIYIGKLPDDISIRINKLIKLGYRYVFAIKSIDKNEIKVFIREVARPDKYATKPSFSADKIDYIPYTPPEMIHEKPNVATFEEESEASSDTGFSEYNTGSDTPYSEES